MKKHLSPIIGLLVVSILLMGCGSTKTGAIQGRIVSVEDGTPIAGVQVILCNVPADAYEHLICTLQSTPTATTDSAGNFELGEVPTGTYILMFGLPGVLKLAPEEWDGIDVTRGTICMQAGENSVCEIEGVPPSEFWAAGSIDIGAKISAFEYQAYEQQPGVVILASAEEGSAGEDFHIFQGAILSNRTGILANIMGGQYSPLLQVMANKTTTIEVEIPVE